MYRAQLTLDPSVPLLQATTLGPTWAEVSRPGTPFWVDGVSSGVTWILSLKGNCGSKCQVAAGDLLKLSKGSHLQAYKGVLKAGSRGKVH